jgi:tetratricopeptide (TPR) repeat protein
MRIIPLVVAVVVAVLGSADAVAQPTWPSNVEVDKGEQLFNEGVAASEQGDFAVALESFQESYRLNPLPDVLYNVGMCQKALGDLPAAANTFRDYVAAIGGNLSPAEQAEFDALLAELVPQVGRISFSVSEQDARVAVDDVAVDAGALGSWLAVAPGPHSITAEKDGFSPASVVLDVAPGDTVEARLVLAQQEGSDDDDGLSPTWFWITAGTAGALALAGAITGGLELADEDTFNNAADRCNAGDDASCAAARTVYATIEDEANATTALLVVAGVAAAAAVTLIFFTDWGGESEPPVAVGVAPIVAEGGGRGAMLSTTLRF